MWNSRKADDTAAFRWPKKKIGLKSEPVHTKSPRWRDDIGIQAPEERRTVADPGKHAGPLDASVGVDVVMPTNEV